MRDAVIEYWIREEVLPVYDAMVADPKRGIPADEVFAAIREHHAERLRKLKREG